MDTTIKNNEATQGEGGVDGETAGGAASSFEATPTSSASNRKARTEEKSCALPSDAPLTPNPPYIGSPLDPEQPIETPVSSKATRFPFAGVSSPNLGSMAPGGKASDERTLAYLRQCSSDSGLGDGAVLTSLEAIDGSSLEFLRHLAIASMNGKEGEGEILIDEGDLERIGGTMQQGETLGNEMATAAATVASAGTASQLLFSDVNSMAGAGDSVGLGASEHSFVPAAETRKEGDTGESETHAAVGELDEQESITTEASRSFSLTGSRASGTNVIEPKSLALLIRPGDNGGGDDDVTVATATKSRVSLFETVPEGVGGDDVDDEDEPVDRPRVVIVGNGAGGGPSRHTLRPPSEIRQPELVRNVSELTGLGGAAAVAAARAAITSRHQLNLDADDLDDDELTEGGATLTTTGTGFGGSVSNVRASPLTHPRSVATDAAVAAARRRRSHFMDDEDMEALDLEPWQRLLFAELRSQREAINHCQLRIEELTRALSSGPLKTSDAANFAAASRSLDVIEDTGRKSRGPGMSENLAPTTARTQRADVAERQRGLPQPGPGYVQRCLTALWTFMSGVATFVQLRFSRFYRVFVLFRQEAQRRRVRFFHLDFGTIFKILIMYIIISSHGQRRRRRNNNNRSQNDVLPPAVRKIWNFVQIPFYVCCGVLIYLSQIGAFGLLYDFFVVNNIPLRVLKGENITGNGERIEELQEEANVEAPDVPPNVDPPPDAQVVGRGDGGAPDPEGEGAQARNIPEAENAGLRQRRGQRDRGGGDDAGGARGGGAANAALPEAAAPPPVRPQPGFPRRRQRNFMEGGIRRRVRNRHQGPVEAVLNAILDFNADLVYLFGSFFLSLLPTWHPEVAGEEEPIQEEPVEEEPIQEEPNEDNDADPVVDAAGNNNQNRDEAPGNDRDNNPNNNNNIQ